MSQLYENVSIFFQKELDQVVLEWNIHKIRKSRNSISPVGRPTIMFEIPEFYEARSYLTDVPDFAIDAIEKECTFLRKPCDEDFFNLCCIIMNEHGYRHEDDPYKALELYLNLRGQLKELLQ